MERARRIAGFWNWLPTFRAVAENEHLGRAAQALGVSSPAVSRTIHLLEDEMGVELLERDGRGLRLTEAGKLLQVAVRDAMRTVHEASSRFEQSGFMGDLRVSSISPATEQLLVPCLSLLKERHPGIIVHHCQHALADTARALMSGELDVALVRGAIQPKGISVRRLREVPVRVFCARGLEVSRRNRVQFDALSRMPFVALTGTHGDDPFPLSVPRTIVMKTETFEDASRAAIELNALAVLPEEVGQEKVKQQLLSEVNCPRLRPLELSVAWRKPLALSTPSDAFVESLLERAEQGSDSD